MPPECTYTFSGSERSGECECGEGACCAVPRVGGEPGGAPMPLAAGGEPCKHLYWEETGEMEKSAGHPALPILNRSNELYSLVGGPQ